MTNLTISDLKPVQSQHESISDSELNSIVGGTYGPKLEISPYVKPSYDFSSDKFSVEVGVKFTFKF